MTVEQIAVGAACLDIDPRTAAEHAIELDDGIMMVTGGGRGGGSVLVGGDLSALYFPSYMSPTTALEAWNAGKRTPPDQFLRQ